MRSETRERLRLVVCHVDGGDPRSRCSRLSSNRISSRSFASRSDSGSSSSSSAAHHERAREREALLLATGQVGGGPVGKVIEVTVVMTGRPSADVFTREGLVRRGRPSREMRHSVHVMFWPDRVGLEHHPKADVSRRCDVRPDEPSNIMRPPTTYRRCRDLRVRRCCAASWALPEPEGRAT